MSWWRRKEDPKDIVWRALWEGKVVYVNKDGHLVISNRPRDVIAREWLAEWHR